MPKLNLNVSVLSVDFFVIGIAQEKFNDLNTVNFGDGFPFPADNERIQRFMDTYVAGSSYEIMEFDPVSGKETPKMVEKLIAYDDAVGPIFKAFNCSGDETFLYQLIEDKYYDLPI